MTSADREGVYKLFREHDYNLGSSGVAILALRALMNSLENFEVKDIKSFRSSLEDLFVIVRSAEPRIVPLTHMVEKFQRDMRDERFTTVSGMREAARKTLQILIEEYYESQRRIVKSAAEYVKDHELILVHSPSSVVADALVYAKVELKRRFQVLVLQHDKVKTRRLIRKLSEGRIRYHIVPEYDLSHYVASANKLFVGALSVTRDRLVVAGVGTSSVVSLCHVNDIPVYLFLNTLKISHKSFKNQHIHEETEQHKEEGMDFRVIKHSHDTVSLELIDHLVTERGELLINSVG